MFLPAVHRFCDERFGRFAEEIFLGHAADFQRHGRAADALDDMMVQERHTAFDRVRHFHPVTKQIEDVIGQK